MIALAALVVGTCQKPGFVENPVFPKLYSPPTHGANLSLLDMRSPIKLVDGASSGKITFPFPANFEGQRVVSLEITTDDQVNLKSWKLEVRPDGINRVFVAEVSPKGKGGWIGYKAIVMTPGDFTANKGGRDIAQWKESTACVQSSDVEIQALSKKLGEESKDTLDYVTKSVDWVALNNGRKGQAFTALDAKSGLLCGGSCTDRANLCAALLRAHGIPARTVAHMPTWVSGKGKLFQHWLTEYCTPDGTWHMVEPTLGLIYPGRNTVVELAVSSKDDENRAYDPIHLRMTMPGSAYGSLPDVTKELQPADLTDDDAMNEIKLLHTYDKSLNRQIQKWADRQSRRVEKEARNGRALRLEAEQVSQAKDVLSLDSLSRT